MDQRRKGLAELKLFESDFDTSDDIGNIPLTEDIIERNKYTLRQIYRSHRPVTENMQCKVCGRVISKKLGFIDHLRKHTKDFVGHCKYCGRGVTRVNHLRVHENLCAAGLKRKRFRKVNML